MKRFEVRLDSVEEKLLDAMVNDRKEKDLESTQAVIVRTALFALAQTTLPKEVFEKCIFEGVINEKGRL